MGWIKNIIKVEERKHKDLDWQGIAEIKIVDSILEFCSQNNTIEFKNSKLRLAILDGGWVNVLKLKEFLEGRE